MNASMVKLIAIGVVVIVAAAGVTVFLVTRDDGKSSVSIDAALEVYGNADNDYKIDANDKDVIQKVIDGDEGYNLEKYPLADANYDGEVNQADLDVVDKIINGESTTVYHINYITNTEQSRYNPYVADTKWPIAKCIGNGTANALVCYMMVGLQDKISAINYSAGSPPDATLYPAFHEMPSLGTSSMYLTASLVTAAVAADTSITAVITADNKSYLSSTASGRIDEAGLEDIGLDVIRIRHAAVDAKDFGSALLLLGFLFQKESNAYDAIEWIQNAYGKLNDKIKDVTPLKALAASGDNGVSGTNSDYSDVVKGAGAVLPWNQYDKSSYALADIPWVYDEDKQPDKIVMIRTGGSYGSWYVPDGMDLKKFDDTCLTGQFSAFRAYTENNIYLISGDMPIVARVMYAAVALYPDLVSEDFADEIHQDFVDTFLGSSYNVSELQFIHTSQEIKAAGAVA